MFGRKKQSDLEEYKKITIEEPGETAVEEKDEDSGSGNRESLPVQETGQDLPVMETSDESSSETEPSQEELPKPEPEADFAHGQGEETDSSDDEKAETTSAEAEKGEPLSPPKKTPQPGWLKWLKRICLGILILLASLALTFGYSLWSEFSNDRSADGKEIVVEIPKGSTTRQTARILKEAGVIKYETSFMARVLFSGYRGKLKYGTFYLNDGTCLKDVVVSLTQAGPSKDEISFTVPEGFSIEMIADKLEKENIMSSDEFLAAVKSAVPDCPYYDQLPAKDQVFYQLQGYLFPDTYHISENMTGDQLVKMMMDNFISKFDAERQKKAEALGLSVEEVLIRASLVQKESQVVDDYAAIAGVINNRLEKNMKLQFDTTAVYALTNGLYGVSKVTYDDLKLESPYNTYYVKGLPPGPICNPGLDAIDGILNPQDNNYLFFQTDSTKDDGSSVFFETYEEHSAAQAGETSKSPAADTTSAPAADTAAAPQTGK